MFPSYIVLFSSIAQSLQQSPMAGLSLSLWKLVATTLALITAAHAQAASPTQTWNIAAATGGTTNNVGCVLGLANQADPNGYYNDPYGARYVIRCQQDSNAFYYDNVGTTGQGAYGCSKGCDNRPNCRGWSFIGYQQTGTTGSGRCYYRLEVGQYSQNSTVYAGAELLSNGTPRLPCPYYNSTIYTDSQGYQWQVRCGFDTSGSDTGTALLGGYNMTDCFRGCNDLLSATSPCSQFSYNMGAGNAVPADNGPGGANCYYKSGPAAEYGGGTIAAAYAARVATTPVSISSTPATATASATPIPNPNYTIPPPIGSVNASTGCGKPLFGGLTAGGSTVQFTWTTAPDGFQRIYRVHIPQFYNVSRASPLILSYSGNGGTAQNIEDQTRYSTAALNPYGIAVYVQGVGSTTGYISNPDYGPTSSDASIRALDDLSFMKQFIPWLTNNFCVDVGRIWTTGHSNGGGFVQVMACDPYLSMVISVFTGNSAAMYTNFTTGDPDTITPVNTPVQAICSPGRNDVAYLEVHGTADTTISYYGGIRRNRVYPSIPNWQRQWAIRQGYPTTNVTTVLNVRGSVGTGGSRYEYGTPQGILTEVMLNDWVHDYATTDTTGFDSSQNFMDFFYRQTSTWGTGRTPAISSSGM